ncbi:MULTISPECIES: hypothetical protein [Vibrio harveyi group]|uniref:hypothetical protein n=1 Tax=Vibrio harveyi group TaxID=717610 RepID=UPI0017860AD7|nr:MULTISPECIES: hypothetical protein [Vibrio harveyi group]MBD6945402.1 hypothetical protein [Vibrio parahaemolyticus]MBD6958531.1 hypothetical protein [Vibrio parahaemolyticus]MBD6979581.1 hypothetical protein [Vibrio parahaemolyticus]MBD6992944.1 hypothetical protein [Vibrio parahaemolyticus]MCR9939399.1 hypothetical protein [Vibrio owensii]
MKNTIKKTAKATTEIISEIHELRAQFRIKSLVQFCLGNEKPSNTFENDIDEITKGHLEDFCEVLEYIQPKNQNYSNDEAVYNAINNIRDFIVPINEANHAPRNNKCGNLTITATPEDMSIFLEQFRSANIQADYFGEDDKDSRGRKKKVNFIHFIHSKLKAVEIIKRPLLGTFSEKERKFLANCQITISKRKDIDNNNRLNAESQFDYSKTIGEILNEMFEETASDNLKKFYKTITSNKPILLNGMIEKVNREINNAIITSDTEELKESEAQAQDAELSEDEKLIKKIYGEE